MTALQTPAITAPQSARPAPHQEPLWLLRINPLLRSRLGNPALRDLLARLAEAERAVRSAAEHCSEELSALIGSTADDGARGPGRGTSTRDLSGARWYEKLRPGSGRRRTSWRDTRRSELFDSPERRLRRGIPLGLKLS